MMRLGITLTLIAVAAGGALLSGLSVFAQGPGTPAATPAAATGPAPLVWRLTELTLPDGTLQTPADPALYTIQFLPDGSLGIRADCNVGNGTYQQEDGELTIQLGIFTLVACAPDSLDRPYLDGLAAVTTFAYEDDALVLTGGAGTLRFTPALTGVVWQWQGFEGGDGTRVVPDDPARYTVTFLPDGTVHAQVDCNQGSGSYTATAGQIDISTLVTTRMACPEGSLDTEFGRYLDEAVSYVFRDGRLFLSLPADAGIAEFAAAPPESPATPSAG